MSTLEERGEQAQQEAIERARALVAQLRHEGWDFVVVQLSRVVRGETESLVPGASFFRCSNAIGPALPREADTLRNIADGIDAEFQKLDCCEATEGWLQDVPLEAAQ